MMPAQPENDRANSSSRPDTGAGYRDKSAQEMEPASLLAAMNDPADGSANNYEPEVKLPGRDQRSARWKRILHGETNYDEKNEPAPWDARAMGFASEAATPYYVAINDPEKALGSAGQDYDQVELTMSMYRQVHGEAWEDRLTGLTRTARGRTELGEHLVYLGLSQGNESLVTEGKDLMDRTADEMLEALTAPETDNALTRHAAREESALDEPFIYMMEMEHTRYNLMELGLTDKKAQDTAAGFLKENTAASAADKLAHATSSLTMNIEDPELRKAVRDTADLAFGNHDRGAIADLAAHCAQGNTHLAAEAYGKMLWTRELAATALENDRNIAREAAETMDEMLALINGSDPAAALERANDDLEVRHARYDSRPTPANATALQLAEDLSQELINHRYAAENPGEPGAAFGEGALNRAASAMRQLASLDAAVRIHESP